MQPIEDRSTKGILRAQAGDGLFRLSRYEAAEPLRSYVQHYWTVEWDLRSREPYTQKVLSHPNVNFVLEKGKTRIYGIWDKTAVQVLEGVGRVFGVKFNPGGFHPFWGQPLSTLTERSIGAEDVFGAAVLELEKEVLSADDLSEQVGRMDRFLLDRLPEADANVELVNRIVAKMAEERDIVKVDQLSDRFALGARTLQRLFDRYVGVSPKGVIQRFRMHEVAERIEKDKEIDWADLSAEMGYYDQAHLIRDFKALLGKTPEEYARDL
ncbi:DUF6597 domain-containing transcriptional factor [Cohnella soli]|uniref:DUF6597 domain-containing transcriptional factor n=1 Tax=Cohnella soli TaxID=425005 RepID=A0ABW0HQ71_9BACL